MQTTNQVMHTAPPLDSIEPGCETLKEVSASQVGAVAPDCPEGSSINDPHFMRSTWHLDPINRTFKNPAGWLAYRLMVKDEFKVREGKMGVHSVWTQRTRQLYVSGCRMLLSLKLHYFRCLRISPRHRPDGDSVHICEILALHMADMDGHDSVFRGTYHILQHDGASYERPSNQAWLLGWPRCA